MSKWTKANEYVPVTKGSTAVITLQSDGDIYGYMDASATGVLLASASAGIAKIPTGSFSKITCTAPFILTTESAMSRLRGGQGQNGGGGTTDAYVTWGGEKNKEVTLNVPADVDIPLAFSSRNITKLSGTGGGITDWSYMCSNCSSLTTLTLDLPSATNCGDMCSSCSSLTTLTLDLPSATNCTYMCSSCSSLTTLTLDLPSATNCGYMCYNCSSLTTLTLDLPSATDCGDICSYCTKLASLTLDLPLATNCRSALNKCTSLTSLSFNFASMTTVNFTSMSGNGGPGNVTTLENVTVLEGGLAACTSFNIKNSTNLTDTSIQNIIDALPNYSGTETSALVTFPSGRLSTEQQEAITAKGWTWA